MFDRNLLQLILNENNIATLQHFNFTTNKWNKILLTIIHKGQHLRGNRRMNLKGGQIPIHFCGLWFLHSLF